MQYRARGCTQRGNAMKDLLNRRQVVGMAGAGLALLATRAARATTIAADWAAPDFVVLNAQV
jgi:hypothetical protein